MNGSPLPQSIWHINYIATRSCNRRRRNLQTTIGKNMFATIETKGATHIAIYIPHEGSEKSLPALARMLEQNAVFINAGYNEAKTVTPAMNITLGDKFQIEGYNHDAIAVATSGSVISEDFVSATPQVFASNAEFRKKSDAEQSRLRSENSYLKSEIDSLKAKLAELAAVDTE